MKKKILIVVGTRPNFIKITRFREVVKKYENLSVEILHTGQHFDEKMADIFFRQLDIIPDHFLDIGPGSPIGQMAQIILRLEKKLNEIHPDIILVPGDVNSTFAAALTANKMNIPVAHLESGLRSFDRSMPEEFNRILTDVVADLLFITEPSGISNLASENISKDRVHFVGNTMIDTLVKFKDEIENAEVLEMLNLTPQNFVLMTIHRPSTVDTKEGLEKLLGLLEIVMQNKKVVFPVHPRTLKNISAFGLERNFSNLNDLLMVDPLDYFSFQKMVKHCHYILTDSGGIQEESTFLGVPCLTLRPNTERPITITDGTNEIVPFDLGIISEKIRAIENGNFKKGKVPELWDGYATERVVEILNRFLQ